MTSVEAVNRRIAKLQADLAAAEALRDRLTNEPSPADRAAVVETLQATRAVMDAAVALREDAWRLGVAVGLSRRTVAQHIGVNPNTVQRWATETDPGRRKVRR